MSRTLKKFVKGIMITQGGFNGGDSARIISGTQDPRSTPVEAEKGSLYMMQGVNGEVFVKKDDGMSTNWALVGGPSDVTLIDSILQGEFRWSKYNLLSDVIFARDEDDYVDNSLVTNPGAYSQANQEFEFSAAGQGLGIGELLDPVFIDDEKNVAEVRLTVIWNKQKTDTNATYQVSRNGGANWSTITMEAVENTGIYTGVHVFAQEPNATLASATGNSGSTVLNTSTTQAIGQKYTPTGSVAVRGVTLNFVIGGTPVGNFKLKLVKDSSGLPSTAPADVLYDTGFKPVSDITGGIQTFDLGETVVKSGTYHIILETDSIYKNGYTTSGGANNIALVYSSGGGGKTTYNGTTWAAGSDNNYYAILGQPISLVARIISSAANKSIQGLGVFYDQNDHYMADGSIKIERKDFKSQSQNYNTFTLGFLPDKDLLKVYCTNNGQVFVFPAFYLDGYDVVFPVNTFQNVGGPNDVTVTLIFDQSGGSSFDNSDENKQNIARLIDFQTISANTTISVTNRYKKILADSSSGAFTITLPATPELGTTVEILDSKGTCATNNITVGRNGNNINGLAQNLVIDVNNANVRLVYTGGAFGWGVYV